MIKDPRGSRIPEDQGSQRIYDHRESMITEDLESQRIQGHRRLRITEDLGSQRIRRMKDHIFRKYQYNEWTFDFNF